MIVRIIERHSCLMKASLKVACLLLTARLSSMSSERLKEEEMKLEAGSLGQVSKKLVEFLLK